MTSKIHLATNALGKFCRILGGPGQESDYKQAPALLDGYCPLYSMADKGYDSDLIIALMEGPDKMRESVIPPKSNRKEPRYYDADKYRGRNVVERAINKLKFFRRVATRFDKLLDNFMSFVAIAATIINLR